MASSADEALPLGVGAVRIVADAQVTVDVVCQPLGDVIDVTGDVAGEWVGPCGRCDRELEGTARVAVAERFIADPSAQRNSATATTGDGTEYLLAEAHLDLTEMVRDALLLELPVTAAKCPNGDGCEHLPEALRAGGGSSDSSEADGSAPHEGSAGHPEDRPVDPRWAALDVLRTGNGA